MAIPWKPMRPADLSTIKPQIIHTGLFGHDPELEANPWLGAGHRVPRQPYPITVGDRWIYNDHKFEILSATPQDSDARFAVVIEVDGVASTIVVDQRAIVDGLTTSTISRLTREARKGAK